MYRKVISLNSCEERNYYRLELVLVNQQASRLKRANFVIDREKFDFSRKPPRIPNVVEFFLNHAQRSKFFRNVSVLIY